MLKPPWNKDRLERPTESAALDQEWFEQAVKIDYLHAMESLWQAFRQYASMGHREAAITLSPLLGIVGFDSSTALHFLGSAIGRKETRDQLPRLLSELESLVLIPGQEQLEREETNLIRRVASVTSGFHDGVTSAEEVTTLFAELSAEHRSNRGSLLFLRDVAETLLLPNDYQSALLVLIDSRLAKSGKFRQISDHEVRKLFQAQFPNLPLSTLNESGRLPIEM